MRDLKSLTAGGNRVHKRLKYDLKWKVDYSCIIELRESENSEVIGILCSICRTNYEKADKVHLRKTVSTFVNRPFCHWNKGKTKLFKHEFGNPEEKCYPKEGSFREVPVLLRQRYLGNNPSIRCYKQTKHMEWFRVEEERRRAEKSATDMPHFIQSSKNEREQEN